MHLAEIVKTGPVNRPQRGIIYGVEGVGKTWLATQFPQPIIVDTEAGSHRYDCSRITVGNDHELETALELLLHEKNDYRTVIFDTVDWVERYLIDKICRANKVTGIEDFGYGKGWTYVREAFGQFLMQLDGFIRAGRHAILVGHAQVKRIQLPGLGDAFDRYELKLDKRNADTATEWADFEVFINWDIRTAKTKDGNIRAVGGRERLIYVVHAASHDAKNRLGLTEPLKCEYVAIAPLLEVLPDRSGVAAAAAEPPAAQTASTETTATAAPSPVPIPAAGPPPAPVAAPDSRTDKASPNPDEAPTDPFLSDQERRAVEALLSELPQERLLPFLRERELIRPDGDFHDLGPHFLRRVLSDPIGFREAVEGA